MEIRGERGLGPLRFRPNTLSAAQVIERIVWRYAAREGVPADGRSLGPWGAQPVAALQRLATSYQACRDLEALSEARNSRPGVKEEASRVLFGGVGIRRRTSPS